MEMRTKGDYSKEAAAAYERRWMKLYGHDFAMVRGCCCTPLDHARD